MHRVQARVMNQPVDAAGNGLRYKSTVDCLLQSVRAEGARSLWKGGQLPCRAVCGCSGSCNAADVTPLVRFPRRVLAKLFAHGAALHHHVSHHRAAAKVLRPSRAGAEDVGGFDTTFPLQYTVKVTIHYCYSSTDVRCLTRLTAPAAVASTLRGRTSGPALTPCPCPGRRYRRRSRRRC